MKAKMLLMCIIYISIMLGGIGCKDDISHYEGQVVSLNNGDGCFNIIQITHSIPQGLPVHATVEFGLKAFDGNLKVGDIVYFEILTYEKWVGFANANCLWPGYTGVLKQIK